jgi:hypothetical protein
VTLSWPAVFVDFTLQSTDDISDPFSWNNLGVTPLQEVDEWVHRRSSASGIEYFRLMEQ